MKNVLSIPYFLLSLCFLYLPVKQIYAQELIHAQGQHFIGLSWQRSLIYEPGYSFSFSAGGYLDRNSAYAIAFSRSRFYVLEEGIAWKYEPGGDSVLFARDVRRSYQSFALRGQYERNLLREKEWLLIKAVLGSSFGIEKYPDDQDWKAIYGPLIGAELELFFSSHFALISHTYFHYLPKSSFPAQFQLQLGGRFILRP